jgi:hypothetical protein
MNEIIAKLTETNELLRLLLNEKKPKSKVYYTLTEENGKVQTLAQKELLVYLNTNYNSCIKANGLKNLTKIHEVKTNSKYKKIFGEEFKLELKSSK